MRYFLNIYNLLNNNEKIDAFKLLFIMLFVMLLEMAAVWYLIPLMGLFSGEQQDNYIIEVVNFLFAGSSQEQVVYLTLFIYVFLNIFKNISSLILFWTQAKFSNLLKVRLSNDLMKYYIAKPYEFHIMQNSSELIRNTFSEVGTVIGAGVQPFLVIITESFIIVGLVIVLVTVEISGALVAMILVALSLYIIFNLLKSYLYIWGKDREFHDGRRIKYIQQGIASIKDIKIFGGVKVFIEQYKYHNIESAKSTIKNSSIQQVPRLTIESLLILLTALYVGHSVYLGEAVGQMASVLAVFAVSALRLMPSANRIITSLQSIRYGMPIVETIYKDLEDYHKNYFPNNRTNVDSILAFNNDISLRNLSYLNSYHKCITSTS